MAGLRGDAVQHAPGPLAFPPGRFLAGSGWAQKRDPGLASAAKASERQRRKCCCPHPPKQAADTLLSKYGVRSQTGTSVQKRRPPFDFLPGVYGIQGVHNYIGYRSSNATGN